jgi:hypothetical protein
MNLTDFLLSATAAVITYSVCEIVYSVVCDARISISRRNVQGNRFQMYVSLRNYKDIQLVNKESLEEKGYLIDEHVINGWLFKKIHYIYITESQRNPQSTKSSGIRKLHEDIRSTNFHIAYIYKGTSVAFNIFDDIFDNNDNET